MNREQRRKAGRMQRAVLSLLVAGALVTGSVPVMHAESADIAGDLAIQGGGGGGGGEFGCGSAMGGGGGAYVELDGAVYQFGGGGNGFTFKHFDGADLHNAIQRALGGYRDAEGWKTLTQRAMSCDFSWDAGPADEYINLFNSLLR